MDIGDQLTAAQLDQLGDLADWRLVAGGLDAWFGAPSHAAGAALVRRITESVSNDRTVPDIDLRAAGVHVRFPQRSLTTAVAERALAISASANELGLPADPSALQTLRLVIDALDRPSILPFWQAVLGYAALGEGLVDPLRRLPALSFQQQDPPRRLRNRIHVDASGPQVSALQGAEPIQAVGGRYAGSNDYTLADAEGNEVDAIAADGLGSEPETADWQVLFSAATFYPVAATQAAELATVVADLADDAGLPMLIDVRPEGVMIDTGKDRWEDERFPALARRIQAAARGMTLSPDPTVPRFMQFGIDAIDIPSVRAFWCAVLGYEYDTRPWTTDIYDPRAISPPIFFQDLEPTEEERRRQRNRIHLDVFVPHDHARARVDTALAAGGRITHDDGPERWTLVDPEGNELDIICTPKPT